MQNQRNIQLHLCLGAVIATTVLLHSFCTNAQDTGTTKVTGKFAGRTYNSKYRPLANATVQVYQNDLLVGAMTSDDEGNFNIEALPVGQSSVVLSRKGYDSLTLTGLNMTTKTLTLNIPLNRSPKLQETVVHLYCNRLIYDADNPTKFTFSRYQIDNMPIR